MNERAKIYQKTGIKTMFVLAFIFVLASFDFAQMEKPPTEMRSATAVVFSKAFENKKSGIRELVEAYDKLESEFKSFEEEFKASAEKLKKLDIELSFRDCPVGKDCTKEEWRKERENKLNEYRSLTD